MTENKTPKTTQTAFCNCGCGEATSSSKTLYKPGHDARHVGMIARDDVESALNETERKFSYEDLPSAALQAKSRAMADRLMVRFQEAADKAERKLAKKTTKLAKADSLAATVAQEEAEHAEQSAPPAPEWEDEGDLQEVKVGRWVYPARRLQDGTTERNTKRDGSGEWVAYKA